MRVFESIGIYAYRFKYLVIGFFVAITLGLGAFAIATNYQHRLSMSGWFDPTSEASVATDFLDKVNGRDHVGDAAIMVTAPKGKQIINPQLMSSVAHSVQRLVMNNRKYISTAVGFTDFFYGSVIPDAKLTGDAAQEKAQSLLEAAEVRYIKIPAKEKELRLKMAQRQLHVVDASATVGLVSISLVGNSDDEVATSYRAIRDQIIIPGVQVQLVGRSPITIGIFDQMDKDVHRAAYLGVPLVAILLFFVFGGLVAMALPLITGGLTILGGWGIVGILSYHFPITNFVVSIIELIGLGIATDYGLFIVSRFREELAEGYSPEIAVRRTLMSAGRTVVMSGILILCALSSMMIFPQNFLRSTALGAFLAVLIAMVLSITLLPAILGILGPRIDMYSVRFLRKAKTKTEVEMGFWAKFLGVVLRRPFLAGIPVIALLGFMTYPVAHLKLGGMSSKYLPQSNVIRQAEDKFDELFPEQRAFPISVLIFYGSNDQVNQIQAQLNQLPGFASAFERAGSSEDADQLGVTVLKANIKDENTTKNAVRIIRSMHTVVPIMITGFYVLAEDSITGVFRLLPLMIILLVITFTIIMFLAFGSLVLPLKAVILSAATLLATMGALTWIFSEGHLQHILNFSPGPLMAVVLVIIIAIVFGLSTDYEIFLISRMIESKGRGQTTSQAIISGTAQTSRIITAAALILVAVAAAFAFSDLVLMKYIAIGLVMALLLDATLVRMILVPAIMIITGEDNWWAPRWMRKVQDKFGFGEIALDDTVGNAANGDTEYSGSYWERPQYHDITFDHEEDILKPAVNF